MSGITESIDELAVAREPSVVSERSSSIAAASDAKPSPRKQRPTRKVSRQEKPEIDSFSSLTSHSVTDIIDQLGNDKCADCGSLGAEWASVSFGICVCTKCSGRHRGLGSHITRVRSLVLDTWGGQDIARMLRGGNIKFTQYLEEHGLRDLIFEHKYRHPRVLYFKALLQAELDQAPPPPYVEERYALSDSNAAITMAKAAKAPPQWVPDTSTSGCMICQKSFTLLFRRHHCRRCGKCVCMECAPKENARPILEWGMTAPVRHCKQCFKSPTLEWSEPSPSSGGSRHSR